MPQFNRTGQVTPQLGYRWFDQTRFIYQDCSTGVCKIVLSDGTLIVERGCNDLSANGAGRWAAWLGGYGVFDSMGRHFPESGLGPMGPNGEYAIKVLRNSYGPWDVINPDGSRWRLTDGDANDIQLLGNGKALWTIGGHILSNFFPVVTPAPVWWPTATIDGDLLYQANPSGELVLNGHVIGPTGNYFYPDLMKAPGGFSVTWSPSQADVDAQIRYISLEELRSLPLVGTPITVPVITVPPPPKEPMLELEAPNKKKEVAEVVNSFPLAIRGDEVRRQEVVNAVIARLGGFPWGRKAKSLKPLVLNTDALTYRRKDGLFEIYDIISGGAGKGPTWAGPKHGPIRDGDNGYFYDIGLLHIPDPGPAPSPTPEPTQLTEADVNRLIGQAIGKALGQLRADMDTLNLSIHKLDLELDPEIEGTFAHRVLSPHTVDTTYTGKFGLSHNHKVTVKL